jgi:hypothetical protein
MDQPFPECEVTWYLLSSYVIRLREGPPLPLDVDRPDSINGINVWVEFPNRDTALKFREDLYAFVSDWDAEK